MGYEAICNCSYNGASAEGKAMLETDFIQFRADAFRFKAEFKSLSGTRAGGDDLEIEWADNAASLRLGEKDAKRWADKILNPPSRLEKLGIKTGTTVHLIGDFEKTFREEVGPRLVPVAKADLIFFAAPDKQALVKVPPLAKRLKSDAALWIVYPKGRTEIREIDVLTAGRAAGLTDVKVVRFSATETALKFVIPLVARK